MNGGMGVVFSQYGGQYVGCNPVEVGQAAERRIKKLETAIRSSRALADHGVHGECSPVEACEEIHKLLTAALMQGD